MGKSQNQELKQRVISMFIGFLLVGILLIIPYKTAMAENSKCWGGGQDDKSRPDVVCTPLTEKFILSFKGATREEVVKRMTSGGTSKDDGIHYLSNDEKYDGDLNFVFRDDKVAIIFASVGENFHKLIWNKADNFFCSDFPESENKCSNVDPEKQLIEMGVSKDQIESLSAQQ